MEKEKEKEKEKEMEKEKDKRRRRSVCFQGLPTTLLSDLARPVAQEGGTLMEERVQVGRGWGGKGGYSV